MISNRYYYVTFTLVYEKWALKKGFSLTFLCNLFWKCLKGIQHIFQERQANLKLSTHSTSRRLTLFFTLSCLRFIFNMNKNETFQKWVREKESQSLFSQRRNVRKMYQISHFERRKKLVKNVDEDVFKKLCEHHWQFSVCVNDF
jgi:hypothetical protein